jgi:hypothetical protein
MLADNPAEVWEAHPCGFSSRTLAFQQRQFELHRLAVSRFLRLKVPLAEVRAAIRTPAEADGAMRQHHLASLVEGDRFPFRVVGLAELAVKI